MPRKGSPVGQLPKRVEHAAMRHQLDAIERLGERHAILGQAAKLLAEADLREAVQREPTARAMHQWCQANSTLARQNTHLKNRSCMQTGSPRGSDFRVSPSTPML